MSLKKNCGCAKQAGGVVSVKQSRSWPFCLAPCSHQNIMAKVMLPFTPSWRLNSALLIVIPTCSGSPCFMISASQQQQRRTHKDALPPMVTPTSGLIWLAGFLLDLKCQPSALHGFAGLSAIIFSIIPGNYKRPRISAKGNEHIWLTRIFLYCWNFYALIPWHLKTTLPACRPTNFTKNCTMRKPLRTLGIYPGEVSLPRVEDALTKKAPRFPGELFSVHNLVDQALHHAAHTTHTTHAAHAAHIWHASATFGRRLISDTSFSGQHQTGYGSSVL